MDVYTYIFTHMHTHNMYSYKQLAEWTHAVSRGTCLGSLRGMKLSVGIRVASDDICHIFVNNNNKMTRCK